MLRAAGKSANNLRLTAAFRAGEVFIIACVSCSAT